MESPAQGARQEAELTVERRRVHSFSPIGDHRLAKDIAFAANGFDIGLLACAIAQALPQATHQQVDGTIEHFRVPALREVEQLVPASAPVAGWSMKTRSKRNFGATQRVGRAAPRPAGGARW